MFGTKVKAESHFDDLKYMLDHAEPGALEKIGKMGHEEIDAQCPVISGRLRDHDAHEVKSHTVIFSNDARTDKGEFYGGFVHLGTMYQYANPWMLRGIYNKAKAMAEELVEAFRV